MSNTEIEKIIQEVQRTYGSSFCRHGALEFYKKLKERGLVK